MPGSRFVAFIISNQCGQVLAVGLMVFEEIIRYPRPTYGTSFDELVAHDAKKASVRLRS
jgi:hypothetical protein